MTVEDIFLAAVEKAPRDRAAYLDAACRGDPETRAQVEALLRSHEQAGSLLEQPLFRPGPTQNESSPGAEAGTLIGPYKLLELIGEGGMGTVWMAQQTEPVTRLVAVKLIKEGMDSRKVIARFEAERQALALMDHPNIARVLDGGKTPTGRPYFVMDLVKGVPITKYCDEQHLTPRQRLELFVPVCQAMQHAHQKGIIHRDLKPSNVLVTLYDGRPVPKVIDFGVAKAIGQPLTEQTVVTGFGAIVGTLEYMSPEQAEINQLDVDTRSDIYSLGVLLYELLTGSPPFTRKELGKAGMLEMLRVIREQEPSKPSEKLSSSDALPTLSAYRSTEPTKLTKLVRGELDWIVMKALEKDRNRRYATANGFAADIQCYLADEPVRACPPSVGYLLGKLARRNKGPVMAAALVLVALLAGIAGTSSGMVWALRERDEKARALAAETKARAAEQQARDKALAVLRDTTDDIVENQMARGAKLTEENKEFLRKIIKHFEGFAAVTADDAASRAIRAEGYHRVGLMRHRLGELKQAETAHAEALALQKQLAADFPTRLEFRQDLAKSHNNLGNLLRDTGRLKEAETAHAQALVLQKQLAADFPTRPEFRQDLAKSHNNLGNLLRNTGRLKEAETAYAEALAVQIQLAADFPTRPEFRQDLAKSHNNLGNLLRNTGRLKEAETAYAEALALRKQLAADFPTRPEFRQDLAISYNNLGNLIRASSRLKEAETAHAEALALQKQLAADFPTRPEFRQDVAKSHNNLGLLLRVTGRLQEAETAYAEALALQKQLAADFPNQSELRNGLAGTCVNLANLERARRNFNASKKYLEEAAPHHEAALRANPSHPDYRQFYRNYLKALVQTDAGLSDQAGAKQAAQKLRDLGWNPAGNAYDAACSLSLCIAIVQKDEQATKEERAKQAAFYGDEAIKMLKHALSKGYSNVAQIKKDHNLHPLRQRDDFKKLLAALEKELAKE